MTKVAVILAGCGYLDGAEIREAVIALLALDMAGANVSIFALDKSQHHVVNHLNMEEEQQDRNILVESARIARGQIQSLEALNVNDFDALIMPGGFGVAKNHCSFAFDGNNASVDPLIAQTINSFYRNKKPMGAICISPALVSLIIGQAKPSMTVGETSDVSQAIETLGTKHQVCSPSECIVDKDNKIVSTPAYMDDNASLSDIYQGISGLVKHTLALI